MITAYLLIQQAAAALGIPVATDGIPGPQTDHCAQIIASTIKYRTDLPRIPIDGVRVVRGGGRASHYGGPTDKGDLYEGQSYLVTADPDGSGPKPAMYTPAEYWALPSVVPLRCYLRPEMATVNTWFVKGLGNVGVSYWINTEASAGAMRLYGELARRARSPEGLFVEITNTAIRDASGQYLREVIRVIDWGPTETWTQSIWEAAGKPAGVTPGVTPWRFAVDLLPGVYRRLQLQGKWDAARGRWLDAVDWRVL